MKCKVCGRAMSIVEIFHIKNEYDEDVDDIYWCCENCYTMCIERAVHGRTYRELWRNNNDSSVDHIIKHKFGLGN